MDQHIYMSFRTGTPDGKGGLVFPGSTRMNYRGVADEDPEGFVKTMAVRGHMVVVTKKRSEKEVTPEKRVGQPQAPSWCSLSDLQ